MILAVVILLSAVVVNSQDIRDYRHPYYYNYDDYPKPYSFSYNAPVDYGTAGQSSRQEVADGSGKVEGSYTVTNDEGHSRVVDYVADQGGFRANVRTNEPGTENKNPADVVIDSAAPLTYGPYVPYQYNPRYRRPVVTDPSGAVAPVDPVTGNVLTPGQPGYYNLHSLYRRRNHPYNRSPYNAHYRNRHY